VTYDDIVQAFMTPSAEPVPAPRVPTTPARRLRDALEPIATHGWWARLPAERVASLGLGFFDGYVWGRAAALGQPPASVVVATFGVFEPTLLTAVYRHGSSVASRDDVLAARESGASESLAAYVSDDEAGALADQLLDALDRIDGMGRPLFSALRELPRPTSQAGRLWRAAELVREHRGDGHLAACAAAGLDMIEANVLTELWLGFAVGEYSSTRGFGPDRLAPTVAALGEAGLVEAGALTGAGRARRDAVEAATDASQTQLVALLGDGLERIVAGADRIADRLVGTAFPVDPRKRAAG
jgi:hypothetical protein